MTICLPLVGGAFVTGSPLQSCGVMQHWLQYLAQQHNITATILAVRYPLAPEHPYPAALHSIMDTYKWLVQEHGNTDPIIIGEQWA